MKGAAFWFLINSLREDFPGEPY